MASCFSIISRGEFQGSHNIELKHRKFGKQQASAQLHTLYRTLTSKSDEFVNRGKMHRNTLFLKQREAKAGVALFLNFQTLIACVASVPVGYTA